MQKHGLSLRLPVFLYPICRISHSRDGVPMLWEFLRKKPLGMKDGKQPRKPWLTGLFFCSSV